MCIRDRPGAAEGHLGPRVRGLGHRRGRGDRQPAAGHGLDHEPRQGEGDGPGGLDLLAGAGDRGDWLPARVPARSRFGEHRRVVPHPGNGMNTTSVRPLRSAARPKAAKASSGGTAPSLTGIEVTPVRSTQELDEFIRFQLALYRDDPYFVPPIVAERRDFLNLSLIHISEPTRLLS